MTNNDLTEQVILTLLGKDAVLTSAILSGIQIALITILVLIKIPPPNTKE